ncbi:MAG: hypothetical protein QOE31_1325 [Solirubrobacteraceae bacterium]|nr:hypothetical protein [Solirubrobacteraceae bacterium]
MPVLDRLPRLAELALTGARKAGSAGASVVRDLADDVRRRRQAQDRSSDAPAATPAAAPEQRPPASAPVADPAAPPPSDAPPAAGATTTAPEIRSAAGEPAPDHVDREAVVVAESHDPGAAGSVGAQITGDEPWEGYGELDAQQVVARLDDAGAETVAVVRLYEQLHRNDAGVLEAVDRRLAALDA